MMFHLIVGLFLVSAPKPLDSDVIELAKAVLKPGVQTGVEDSLRRPAAELVRNLVTCRVYEGGQFELALETQLRGSGGRLQSPTRFSGVMDLGRIPWSQAPSDSEARMEFYRVQLNEQLALGDGAPRPNTRLVHTSEFNWLRAVQQKSSTGGSAFQQLLDFSGECLQRAATELPPSSPLVASPGINVVTDWSQVSAAFELGVATKWLFKWLLKALNVVQLWLSCGECLSGDEDCNWPMCIFDILQMLLVFNPAGAIFVTIIDVLDYLCLGFHGLDLSYCKDVCSFIARNVSTVVCRALSICDNPDANGCKCNLHPDGSSCP